MSSVRYYGNSTDQTSRYRILIVAALVWVILVSLEIVASTKNVTDSDFRDIHVSSLAIHVLFSLLLAVSLSTDASPVQDSRSFDRWESTSTAHGRTMPRMRLSTRRLDRTTGSEARGTSEHNAQSFAPDMRFTLLEMLVAHRPCSPLASAPNCAHQLL